jgi:hypothetical protein
LAYGHYGCSEVRIPYEKVRAGPNKEGPHRCKPSNEWRARQDWDPLPFAYCSKSWIIGLEFELLSFINRKVLGETM